MKRILFLLLFITINITSYSQNLIGYYKLDSDAQSFIGNVNGNLTGTVITDTNRFNKPSSSLRFDASNSYISIPNSYDLPAKTFNFWTYLDTLTADVYLFTIDNGSLNHGMVYLQLNRHLNKNRLQFYGGNPTPIDAYIPRNTWLKISITYENSIYKLYINNKLIGSVTSTNIHSIDGYGGIVLGSNRSRSFSNNYNGNVDDLSIYNYALDSTQLANIQEATCDFNNVVTSYDTIEVVDTTYLTIVDTITYIDTLTITQIDTNYIDVYDTIYVSVQDTLIIDVFSSTNPTLKLNTIKVFPNPSTEFITIDNGQFNSMLNYKYEIFTSNGMLMHTSLVNTQITNIDASIWPPGIYFLNIYNNFNQKIEVKKIIIR